MKYILTILLAIMLSAANPAAALKGAGAYYGTNYTVPFAHAYRALDRLGVDHKQAIDRDVYHMSRMGLNAFRLHLWDVELSDAQGNLLQNDHLDLLDYLIAQLERRGISIILTAQTNFGNGYPERNTDPNGAFSYDYEKCRVHDEPAAQAAQANYLDMLVRHVNPYTSKSYAADPSIIAIEINNEPCHSGTDAEITAYVDRMADTLRKAGWDRDILYNVSHNLWHTRAFYDANIDGTTYQWYPTGLVHGSRRKGNFLPVLDNYAIPFDTIYGYGSKSRVIYEFDPADVLDTYLFPAAARTFRKAGFEWMTQFAYDPIDMAAYNTEYQTHYLNLAYTPGKAIGMKIAAEVVRDVPLGADFGTYPADTVFGNFTLSARRNLAMLNDGTRYFNTNNTTDRPKDFDRLTEIAGTGSSPLVRTDGTGAYFIDRIGDGMWRLEVMPDVVIVSDPFAKPSLSERKALILPDSIRMAVNLPGMARKAYLRKIADNTISEIYPAEGFTIAPGTYLLGVDSRKMVAADAGKPFGPSGRWTLGESVLPAPSLDDITVVHTAAPMHRLPAPLTVTTFAAAPAAIDSVMLYPAEVNFWNDNNRIYRLPKTGKNTYSIELGTTEIGKKDCFRYNLVVYSDGRAVTYPGGIEGTPLDWDFGSGGNHPGYYATTIAAPDAPVALLRAAPDAPTELNTIPETWRGISFGYTDAGPMAESPLRLHKDAGADTELMVLSTYVGNIMAGYGSAPAHRTLKLRTGRVEGIDSVSVGLVTRDGFTYSATVPVTTEGTAAVDLSGLTLDDTLLTPTPYPSFLSQRFTPDAGTAMPFSVADIEKVVISVPARPQEATLDLMGIWLE